MQAIVYSLLNIEDRIALFSEFPLLWAYFNLGFDCIHEFIERFMCIFELPFLFLPS